MEVIDVVRKLIGPIEPEGESHIDEQSYENLQAMTKLVDKLLCDIDHVAINIDRAEFSMMRSGKHAAKFMQDVRDSG